MPGQGGEIASLPFRIVIPDENRTRQSSGRRPGSTWLHRPLRPFAAVAPGWGGGEICRLSAVVRLKRFCAACTGGRGRKSIVDHLANNWVGFGRVHLAAASRYAILNLAPPPRDVPAGARLRDISFFLSPHRIFVCKACLRLPGRVATRVPDWRLMPGGCRPCAPFRERQPCAQSARCSGCVHRRGGPALASPLLAACLSAPVS